MEISYQLYSSRNYSPFTDTLAMLTRLGYSQVEGYGGLFADYPDLAKLRDELDSHNLLMPSSHIGIDMIQEDPKRVLDIIKTLDLKAVYAPFMMPDQRPTDAAGWEKMGREIAEAGKLVQDAGVSFGWHNHDFEFSKLDGNDLPLDFILAGSDDIKLELDIAWAVVAEHDPIAWLERYADRVDAVHIKDIAPEGECVNEDGWADVGYGTMDWPALMKAAQKTKARFFVMEHDNPNDHLRFATRSIETVVSL